jgi:LCP family protein required for cell wall assembly
MALLRLSLHRAATIVILTLLSGSLIAGVAGLAHTVAITVRAPEIVQAPSPTPPANPSSLPPPPPSHVDQQTPTALLILGIDGQDVSSNEIDMLILLYLDPETERAFLLSIPRELYVEVPGHGQARAGSVYRIGEQDEDSDGLTLTRQTISDTLGIPVQHAAMVRFESFVAMIDAIGGVDVNVPYAIDDPDFPDNNYGYDPLSIPAGQQHFDGDLALRYARTRVVPAAGFDRTYRQRQIVLAAQERVMQLDMLPDLIAQSPELWAAVADSLHTDLSLKGTIDLALPAASITTDDIATADLGACCTAEHTTPAGKHVLLPQPEKAAVLVQSLLEEKER